MKILIKNGIVLTRTGEGYVLENKNIYIEGNRIAMVLDRECEADFNAEKVIDAEGRLVMPGLINAHTHCYMSIFKNYADDLAFFDWLGKVQAVEDYMDEEDCYWSTLLGIIEMIKSGTTCFVDMNVKTAKPGVTSGPEGSCSAAAADSGIRAVISRGLSGVADSEDSLFKFGRAVAEMETFKDVPTVEFMFGPHAPYSCMADYLQKLTAEAKARGIGQTIHLSESEAEMESMAAEHGVTPIKYVANLGVFDVPVIAAHCVNATDEDIALMAEKNVSVAINPRSNMKLGNGFSPADRMLAGGVNVCLGTDGSGSNNSLNMFKEMSAAGLVYKGKNKQAQCISAEDVLDFALANGAKAIGHEGELGVIAEGALADIILLNLDEPQFVPKNNIISGLVYAAAGTEVETVIVDGKILMEDRKILTIDVKTVYDKCEALAERLGMKS